MSEGKRDNRAASVSRIVLTAAIVVSAVALAAAIVTAVLVDVQSNYLGIQSEQAGGFDPSIFPPGNVALWLIGNSCPLLLAILLVMLITARIIIVGAQRDYPRAIDNNRVVLARIDPRVTLT